MPIIDTHKEIKELMAAGVSEQQAEAFTTALHTTPVNTLNVFRDLVASGFNEKTSEILAQTIFKKHN